MKTLKYPTQLYKIADQFLGCPICGKQVQNKKYKKKIFDNPSQVYRSSDWSLTLRCRNCQLKFTVTWLGLRNALMQLGTLSNNPKKYAGMIKILDATVQTKNRLQMQRPGVQKAV